MQERAGTCQLCRESSALATAQCERLVADVRGAHLHSNLGFSRYVKPLARYLWGAPPAVRQPGAVTTVSMAEWQSPLEAVEWHQDTLLIACCICD